MSDKISFDINNESIGTVKINGNNIESNVVGFNITCIPGETPKINMGINFEDGLKGEIEGNIKINDYSLKEELIKWYNSNEMNNFEILNLWEPLIVNNDLVTSMYTIRMFIKYILNLNEDIQ